MMCLKDCFGVLFGIRPDTPKQNRSNLQTGSEQTNEKVKKVKENVLERPVTQPQPITSTVFDQGEDNNNLTTLGEALLRELKVTTGEYRQRFQLGQTRMPSLVREGN